MKGVCDLHAWEAQVLQRWHWCWNCCAPVGEEQGVAAPGRGFAVARAESGHGSERHQFAVEAASVREGGVLGGSWGLRVQRGW